MISCVRKSHLCSTSLISSALSHPGRLGRDHLLEELGAALQFVGQRLKVVVEAFLSRDQPKDHKRRIVTDRFTPLLHASGTQTYRFETEMPMNNEVLAIMLGGGPGHLASFH